MLSNLIHRLQDMLKPYTLEDFIEDADPKDYKDIQRLEKVWHDYRERKLFNNCF